MARPETVSIKLKNFEAIKNQEQTPKHLNELVEWDYFYIFKKEQIFNIGVLNLRKKIYLCVNYINLTENKIITKREKIYPFQGKKFIPLPYMTSDLKIKKGKAVFNFLINDNSYQILSVFKRFFEQNNLEVNLKLLKFFRQNEIIFTPFFQPKKWFYSSIGLHLDVSGYIKIGEKPAYFNSNSYGISDFVKGHLPNKLYWYNSFFSGIYLSHTISWNLKFGLTNLFQEEFENYLAIDSKVYKIGEIEYDIPKIVPTIDDINKLWHFKSLDGRLSLTFSVIKHSSFSFGYFIKYHKESNYGFMSGTFKDDNNKIIEFKNLFSLVTFVKLKKKFSWN